MSWALTSQMAVIIDWDRVQEVRTLPGYLLGAGSSYVYGILG